MIGQTAFFLINAFFTLPSPSHQGATKKEKTPSGRGERRKRAVILGGGRRQITHVMEG
jgi:hypothetical protein